MHNSTDRVADEQGHASSGALVSNGFGPDGGIQLDSGLAFQNAAQAAVGISAIAPLNRRGQGHSRVGHRKKFVETGVELQPEAAQPPRLNLGMRVMSESDRNSPPDVPSNRESSDRHAQIQTRLLEWYAEHRRDLPWRQTRDPYHVVVSEIMLQQTQVDRVSPYFTAFIERFPGFAALAAAPRADVIQLWAGLGYNRRAVHLHQLAQVVVDRYEGHLPADREALLRLPGIGPYTAGAILSIAFDRDEAALDTNVRRVIARFAFEDAPAERELSNAAQAHVPPGRAADWNQALMDLGSSICTGRRPRCLLCPIQTLCLGRARAGGPITLSRRAPPRFEGSTRYLRGRLLAELRELPAGSTAPLETVAANLARQGVAEPPQGWQLLGEDLARDGLARVEEANDGIALGLA